MTRCGSGGLASPVFTSHRVTSAFPVSSQFAAADKYRRWARTPSHPSIREAGSSFIGCLPGKPHSAIPPLLPGLPALSRLEKHPLRRSRSSRTGRAWTTRHPGRAATGSAIPNRAGQLRIRVRVSAVRSGRCLSSKLTARPRLFPPVPVARGACRRRSVLAGESFSRFGALALRFAPLPLPEDSGKAQHAREPLRPGSPAAGLRRHQRHALPAEPTGRAWIGSSSQEPAQFVRQGLRGGVAARGFLLQALQADRFQIARHAGIQQARRHGLGVRAPVRASGRASRPERAAAGQQVIQHARPGNRRRCAGHAAACGLRPVPAA